MRHRMGRHLRPEYREVVLQVVIVIRDIVGQLRQRIRPRQPSTHTFKGEGHTLESGIGAEPIVSAHRWQDPLQARGQERAARVEHGIGVLALMTERLGRLALHPSGEEMIERHVDGDAGVTASLARQSLDRASHRCVIVGEAID